VNGAKSSSAIATTGTVEPGRPYRGRFAPTPSGALHFGSLLAAVASFVDARARGGAWLLRVEDLDPPRERPGAAADILATLDRLGLHWDGPVLRQSTRTEAYVAALTRLGRDGRLRECACTRAALSGLEPNAGREPGDDLYHPPECLAGRPTGAEPLALRLRVPDREVEFVDRSLGMQRTNVARSVGDFVLRRRDGLFAYQLAVVVDDDEQGITDVVRGADLLQSTPRQILLQEALGLRAMSYMHVPLAVDAGGLKLSKSSDAAALAPVEPARQLADALAFLGQDPPPEAAHATVTDVLDWAVTHWRPGRFAGLARRIAAEYA
jgi:glutamyl-Q tRNA(Asp) synthetase